MTDKHLDPIEVSIGSDKVQKLLDQIGKMVATYGDNLNFEHLGDVLEIVSAADDCLLRGTSQIDDFLTFEDIEQLILEEERLLHDANLKSLFSAMKRMRGEDEVVLKKKQHFEK
jgi:hypothetical protein